MDIRYKITFHSLWHCGSGESKGADLDALVIKDRQGLPYIPGKTIKGLVKDGMVTLREVQADFMSDTHFHHLFGKEAKENDGKVGCLFFKNAVLPAHLTNFLVEAGDDLKQHLYVKLTSTSIDPQNGVADEHTLRSMEATVPMVLEGEIMDVPEGSKEELFMAMQMVKQLGVGRNRGLGRCTFELIEGGAK